MTRRTHAAALAAVVVAAAALSAARLGARRLCEGFLPDNDLKIPVSAVGPFSGLSETAFNRVLDRVEKLYAPVAASKGGRLVVDRNWKDPTVNASASRFWGKWTLSMYGGLARHPVMTEEGFTLVACHEIGHHVGGAPKLKGWVSWLRMDRWATDEGGADYFATLKCLRLALPESGSEQPDAAAAAACAASFPEPGARDRCLGGAMAGQSVARLFQALRRSSKPPSFTTPDPSVVSKTYDGHPDTQCRLDTYFQGALCPKSVEEGVSDEDPNPGACTRRQGFEVGLRPRCWYKPPADEPTGPALAARWRAEDGRRVSRRLEEMRTALEAQALPR